MRVVFAALSSCRLVVVDASLPIVFFLRLSLCVCPSSIKCCRSRPPQFAQTIDIIDKMKLTRIAKIEASLRLGALLLFVLTACLVGLDSETKYVIYVRYRVTYKHLKALGVLVYVCSVVAAYHLLQLGRCYLSARNPGKSYNHVAAWSCYLLDQFVVYITFGVTSAAAEHSVLVLSGADDFQWMKWCNRFTRFCFQIGGSLVCAYVACFLMIIITCISAFNLFRLYSPQKFLALKTA